jgi:hypothetical protein
MEHRLNHLPKGVHKRFTKEEDDELSRLDSIHGDHDWLRVALAMPGRNPRQCRDRYRNYLSRPSATRPWSLAEEDLLRRKFLDLGSNWHEIAKWFEGRSNIDLKNHWASIRNRDGRAARGGTLRGPSLIPAILAGAFGAPKPPGAPARASPPAATEPSLFPRPPVEPPDPMPVEEDLLFSDGSIYDLPWLP